MTGGPVVIETPEGPIEVPSFGPYNPPPLPQIANPLPELVTGAEERWTTISDWVKKGWHDVTSWFDDVASIGVSDIRTIINAALDTSQTAWSSMLSTLEIWTVAGIDEIANTMDTIRAAAREADVELGQMIEALSGQVIDGLSNVLKAAITYADEVIDGLRAEVLQGEAAIEDWVTTTVTIPLLREIGNVQTDVLDALSAELGKLRTWVEDLVNGETLERLAAIGALAATVASIATWVDECGVPMCEEFGPGSQLSSLLNDAKLLELLSLLASLGALADPALVGDIAVPLAEKLGPVISTTLEDWLVPLNAWTKDLKV